MVIVKFNTNGAAFDETSDEIARIFRKIADDVENGATAKAIMDMNGNKVGQWEYDPDNDTVDVRNPSSL
jgi:hypothetical protein